jgi:transposase
VPGRKTDLAEAQGRAILARRGVLRGGFVPPTNRRELRLVSRQLQQFTGILAGEKNRRHKVLTDGGLRLSAVVSDSHGSSARAMIKGLLEGETPEPVLTSARKRLKASEEELLDALEGELRDTPRFVLREIRAHIEALEARLRGFQQHRLAARQPPPPLRQALQTLPGLDAVGAALRRVEIGTDREAFGSPQKRAAWAGVCPGNNESAGKRKAGRKRKGNPDGRRILCEAANAASRTRRALAEKFKALLIRRGRQRALFALAHKILKIVFGLIHRGDDYRDAPVDYEALRVGRNAPRGIRMLRKDGYITA